MNGKNINRRTALRTMLYIAGGTMILPACFRESGSTTISLKSLLITEDQELLLEAILETLIPESETPGASKLLLHLFVLKMVDDCHNPKDQEVFSKGLHMFSTLREQSTGKLFMDLEPENRGSFLSDLRENKSDEINKFYSIAKNRCIQGYLNSKTVMTDLKKYELIPGRYNGYFPVG